MKIVPSGAYSTVEMTGEVDSLIICPMCENYSHGHKIVPATKFFEYVNKSGRHYHNLAAACDDHGEVFNTRGWSSISREVYLVAKVMSE